MLKKIFAITLVLLVSACGDIEPTDPDKLFSLAKFKSTTSGTVYLTNLSGLGPVAGSDVDLVDLDGRFYITNGSPYMLGGVLLIPRDFVLILKGGDTSIAGGTRTLINPNGNIYGSVSIDVSDSVRTPTTNICKATSLTNFPATAKIDDSGTLAIQYCTDNSSIETTWRVDDATNGNILFIKEAINKDQHLAPITTTKETYTLDGTGEIVAFIASQTDHASDTEVTYANR